LTPPPESADSDIGADIPCAGPVSLHILATGMWHELEKARALDAKEADAAEKTRSEQRRQPEVRWTTPVAFWEHSEEP